MRSGPAKRSGVKWKKKKEKEILEYFFAPLARMIFCDIWNVSLNYSCMAGDNQEHCRCNSSLSKP